GPPSPRPGRGRPGAPLRLGLSRGVARPRRDRPAGARALRDAVPPRRAGAAGDPRVARAAGGDVDADPVRRAGHGVGHLWQGGRGGHRARQADPRQPHQGRAAHGGGHRQGHPGGRGAAGARRAAPGGAGRHRRARRLRPPGGRAPGIGAARRPRRGLPSRGGGGARGAGAPGRGAGRAHGRRAAAAGGGA
ncbi:MAG: hypothetical protein AVDCRST_MAG68-2197, partial [uncultured Gemmatimonadetes bacterium]